MTMNPALSALLYPLTLPYRFLVAIDRKRSEAADLGRPVISVGNITWGGTGKTPVVIHLARDLVRRGKKVAVLSRGYGRKDASAQVVVSDGTRLCAGPETAGDEPVLLARGVPEAIVIAGADRRRTAAFAREQYAPDVFILDDGFQHWKVKRDLDIVCIDAADPFGNGRLIPAGSLREPLTALGRAGLILLNNAEAVPDDCLQRTETIVRRYSTAPCLTTVRQAIALQSINGRESIDRTAFKGMKVVALSAIGANDGFKRTLERNGFQVVRHVAFRDHHWYTVDELRQAAAAVPDTMLITTTKDAVRLAAPLQALPAATAQRFFALVTELDFMNGDESWEKAIKNAVRSS